MCYPLCRDGYYGVGPVCWEKCKDSYSDRGVICWIDAHIYGNGCSRNCREGYKNDGCTCRRDVHSYVKKSYGRTAGKPMICQSDEEQNGGLCYPFCRNEHYGVGPVCWKVGFELKFMKIFWKNFIIWKNLKRCKGDNSVDCEAFCAVDEQTCKDKTNTLVADGINLAAFLLLGVNEAEVEQIPENIFTNFCD